jgi:hypothetical protein
VTSRSPPIVARRKRNLLALVGDVFDGDLLRLLGGSGPLFRNFCYRRVMAVGRAMFILSAGIKKPGAELPRVQSLSAGG